MTKLTKKKAIQECKDLWNEIKASGNSKYWFFNSDNSRKWTSKNYQSNCPLCQYVEDCKKIRCSPCPLVVQYGKECAELGYNSYDSNVTKFTKYVNNLKAESK